jgi:hypothetical protein
MPRVDRIVQLVALLPTKLRVSGSNPGTDLCVFNKDTYICWLCDSKLAEASKFIGKFTSWTHLVTDQGIAINTHEWIAEWSSGLTRMSLRTAV